MKTLAPVLGTVALLTFAVLPSSAFAQSDPTPPPQSAPAAQSGESFQTFYDQLQNQGTWVKTNNYGYVWQPTENDPNWRPYTYGHWTDSPDGMMWVSDESFGWATYHYGRWADVDGYGWVWVPGYTWAPAWVSWRDSDDWCGWAPLPPDSCVGIDFADSGFGFDFGFHIGGDCDVAYGIGAGCYNFCPVAYIGDRDAWRHFRDRRDNFALINRTRNVTNINVSNGERAGHFGRVQEGGPSVAALNARARTPIERVDLTRADAPGAGDRMHGNSLAVYAPGINPGSTADARPHEVARSLGNVDVNRGTDINRPLAVNSSLRPAGPTVGQFHAAVLAQDHAPVGAKIATANTRISRPLGEPLTSLRPNAAAGANASSQRAAEGANFRPETSPAEAAVRAPSQPGDVSRYTGEPATPRGSNPSIADRSYTAEPAPERHAPESLGEQGFTGEPAVRHAESPSRTYSSTEAVRSFNSGGEYSHPSAAPASHPAESFHQAPPSVHSFAPAARARAEAPAAHEGGGHAAPAHAGGDDKRH